MCAELSDDFARYGDPARRLATGSKIVTDLCLGADQSPASTCRVTDEYVDLQVDAYSPRNDVSAKSEVRSQKEELRSDPPSPSSSAQLQRDERLQRDGRVTRANDRK